MNSSTKSWIGLILLLVVGGMVVAPASAAATTWAHVTRYADNNYSVVTNFTNMTYVDMANNFTNVYSNGDIYMQQATFNSSDKYGDAGQGMIIFYGHNGTYVRNLTDRVGMDEGDELKIISNDGFKMYFGEDDINSPEAAQPNLVLTWWDSEMGFVPNYSYGMRLYFYDPNPAPTYSVADCLNFTLLEMCNNFDPWYQRWVGDWNGTGSYPNTKGLSVKNVQYLEIYPPHRHDFNTTGDTTEYAFKGEVTSLPSNVSVPNSAFGSTANIADNDGSYVTSQSDTNGCYAAHRFNFTIDTNSELDGALTNIEKLNVTWHGAGYNDNENNGATLYVYNFTAGNYEELDTVSDDSTVYLTGDIVGTVATDGTISGIGNYVNSGNVTVLVKQVSAQSSSLSHSYIDTDYVKLTVTHHHWNS